jgi:hypothetical protein
MNWYALNSGMPTVQVAIRIDESAVKLADDVAKLIAASSVQDVRPTRTAVMRAAMERGLREMKAELAAKPKRK